jgi:hypothetical protein
VRLDLPFYALLDDAGQHHWGQFVFDRGQLDAEQPACWPWSSAPPAALPPSRRNAGQAVAVQLAVVFRCRNWAVRLVQGHHRKTRHLRQQPRPAAPPKPAGLPGLLLAGDYGRRLSGHAGRCAVGGRRGHHAD